VSVYILTSIQQLFSVEVRAQESRQGDGASSANLALSLKQQLSADAFNEQQNYLSTAATAVYVSLNKIDQRNRFKASVQLTSDTQDFNFIAGSSSSGLGYALALFDAWWTTQLGKPGFSQTLYATGEIATNGEIIGISYVTEKINHLLAKLDNQSPGSFVICLPKANEPDIDAELRQRIEQQCGQLLIADRLQDLFQQLLGDLYDGDPLGRWEAFKGLKSFEYEDSIRFFGRDKDIERLNNDLQNNQGVLIVSGQSGSGKSSLIKAGLIPYLEKHHPSISWHSTTPKEIDGSLLDFVLRQLNLHLAEDQQYAITELNELAEAIRQGKANPDHLAAFFPNPNTLLLLHIDQFEEYYTSAQRQANDIELDRVHELTKQLPQLKVIVSIRNEYIAILLESGTIKSPVISNVTGNLSLESWQEIIYEQAAFSGYTFEQQPQDLASVIIDQAIKTPNALPMVEFLLEQIAEKAKDSETPNLLKHEDYQALGGLEGAIATRADACSADNSQQLHTFFSLFVATNNEGIAYARPVAYPAAYIEQNTALDQLIQSLRNANILMATTDNQKNNYLKLSHDSLFTHWQRLKNWILEQQSYLAWRNEIDRSFKQWQQNKNDHYLKDKQQRQEGLRYLKAGLIVEPELISYLQKSQSQANNRRISLLALILIPLLAIAGYFYDQNRIKVAYHTAIAEKWSVPVGLHEISEEQMKKRTGSYKLEYQGGVLRRLSFVNSKNVAIPSNHEYFPVREFIYDEKGLLNRIDNKNEHNVLVLIENINFEDDNKKSKRRFTNAGMNNFVFKFNELDDSAKGVSAVPQVINEYNDYGYVEKLIYLDSFDRNLYYNNHQLKKFSYDNHGKVTSIKFLSKEYTPASDQNGVLEKLFNYNDESEIASVVDVFDGGLVKSLFDRDEYGNVSKISLYSKDSVIFEKIFDLSSNYSVKSTKVFYKALNEKKINSYAAEEVFSYDENGRYAGVEFLDQYKKPFEIKNTSKFNIVGTPKISSKFEYLRNNDGFVLTEKIRSESNVCKEVNYKYNLLNEIVAIVCKDPKESLLEINVPNFGEKISIWKLEIKKGLLKTNIDEHLAYRYDGKIIKVEVAHDERGFVTSRNYYVSNNQSTFNLLSSAVNELDGYGNIISGYVTDYEGKRIALSDVSNNVFNIKYDFNKTGKLTLIAYYGESGDEVSIPGLFHKVMFEYDKNNSVILSEKHYNEFNNQIAIHPRKKILEKIESTYGDLDQSKTGEMALKLINNDIENLLKYWADEADDKAVLAATIGEDYANIGDYKASSYWFSQAYGIRTGKESFPLVMLSHYKNYNGVAPNPYKLIELCQSEFESGFFYDSVVKKYIAAINMIIND
jgi:hypothetical protein